MRCAVGSASKATQCSSESSKMMASPSRHGPRARLAGDGDLTAAVRREREHEEDAQLGVDGARVRVGDRAAELQVQLDG